MNVMKVILIICLSNYELNNTNSKQWMFWEINNYSDSESVYNKNGSCKNISKQIYYSWHALKIDRL